MEDFFHYLIGGIRISNMAHAAVWECVLLLLIRFGKSNYVLGQPSTVNPNVFIAKWKKTHKMERSVSRTKRKLGTCWRDTKLKISALCFYFPRPSSLYFISSFFIFYFARFTWQTKTVCSWLYAVSGWHYFLVSQVFYILHNASHRRQCTIQDK